MRAKTDAIVVSTYPYKESSLLIKMYTESFGLQTYLENGVRSAKGKTKMAFFQPLTWLEMVVYHDDKKEIHRLTEYKCPYPYQTIPYDVTRSCIALFLAEICQKTLKEAVGNPALFQFLRDQLVYFDQQIQGIENFHLFFLVHFASFLGFEIPSGIQFQHQLAEHGIPFRFPELIDHLQGCTTPSQVSFPLGTRKAVLEALIWYYKVHIQDFGEVKSWSVLRTVLSA